MAEGFSSPIDSGLPGNPVGVPDELYDQFDKIYNALRIFQQKLGDFQGLGVLDPSNFIAAGIQPKDSIQGQRLFALSVLSTDTLLAGAMVNLWNSGGLRVRNAVATGIATRCHGYVADACAIGQVAIVFLWAGYAPIAGVTPGVTYYLSSTTPGALAVAPPGVAGMIKQEVGVGISSSEIAVKISTPIVI